MDQEMWGHFSTKFQTLPSKIRKLTSTVLKKHVKNGTIGDMTFMGLHQKFPAGKVGDYLRLIFHQAAIDCTCKVIFKRILATHRKSIGYYKALIS